MQDVPALTSDLPPLHRTVPACLASILEVDIADVPLPAADQPEPWTVWRVWLGTRGLGLVPIKDPQAFSWGGPWIAVTAEGTAAVAYGPPSDIVWDPLGAGVEFGAVVEGYLVAPADPALWARRDNGAGGRELGRVELIAIAPDATAPMEIVDAVAAVAGRGLEGDRHFDGRGTFSNYSSNGHELTLIEGEVTDKLPLAPEDMRRNIVTRGIDLNALVGRRFRVGEVECIARRLCEPCAHLQRITEPGILRATVHIAGLRADILAGGTIGVGDEVAAVDSRPL
jgi:hypothetical protein